MGVIYVPILIACIPLELQPEAADGSDKLALSADRKQNAASPIAGTAIRDGGFYMRFATLGPIERVVHSLQFESERVFVGLRTLRNHRLRARDAP